MCPKCDAHNYARRNECKNCYAARPDGGGRSSRGDRDSGGGGGYGRDRRARSNSVDSYRRGGRDYDGGDRRGGRDGGKGKCFAFERGECRYGDDCKFAHGASQENDRDRRSRNDSFDSRDRDSDRHRGSSRDRGYDRDRGDRDRDRDRGDRGYERRSRDYGDRDRRGGYEDRGPRSRVCYDWQQGMCSRGDICKFDHYDDSASSNARGGSKFSHGRDHGRRDNFSDRGSAPPRGGMRDGDWWCATCNVHKYAFRDSCMTCSSSKTDEAVAVVTQKIKDLEDKGLPANFRPGDWMCPSCSKHIFAKHNNCRECPNVGRPPEGQTLGIFVETVPAALDSTDFRVDL